MKRPDYDVYWPHTNLPRAAISQAGLRFDDVEALVEGLGSARVPIAEFQIVLSPAQKHWTPSPNHKSQARLRGIYEPDFR
jgi:hypothetical protein